MRTPQNSEVVGERGGAHAIKRGRGRGALARACQPLVEESAVRNGLLNETRLEACLQMCCNCKYGHWKTKCCSLFTSWRFPWLPQRLWLRIPRQRLITIWASDADPREFRERCSFRILKGRNSTACRICIRAGILIKES